MTNAPGQSGDPRSHFYDNLLEGWATEAIDGAARKRLPNLLLLGYLLRLLEERLLGDPEPFDA